MAIKFTAKDETKAAATGNKAAKAAATPPKDAVSAEEGSELFPSLAKPTPKKRKSKRF